MNKITITLTEDQARALQTCIIVAQNENVDQLNDPEYAEFHVGGGKAKLQAQIKAENKFLDRIYEKLKSEHDASERVS